MLIYEYTIYVTSKPTLTWSLRTRILLETVQFNLMYTYKQCDVGEQL